MTTETQESMLAELLASGMSRKSALQKIRRAKKTEATGAAPEPETVCLGTVQVDTAKIEKETIARVLGVPVEQIHRLEILPIPAPEPVAVEPPQPVIPPTETEPAPEPKQVKHSRHPFDAALAVHLYNQGTRVVDIAVAMGYERGHGQNRTVIALKKAGVYKPKE